MNTADQILGMIRTEAVESEPVPRRIFSADDGELCPYCGERKMVPLRFETGMRIRTYTCLNPKCEHYRRLLDEDDGDNKRGDDDE